MSENNSDSYTSGIDRLPSDPSRDNYAYDCDFPGGQSDGLPDHIDYCSCANHTGVCQNCGCKVTVSPSEVEYGHARATNRGPNEDGVRRDCTHRPLQCNPGEPQAWDGYDKDEWSSNEVTTDGGQSPNTGGERSEGGDER